MPVQKRLTGGFASERRTSPRYPAHLAATLKTAHRDYDAWVIDVSAHGAAVRTVGWQPATEATLLVQQGACRLLLRCHLRAVEHTWHGDLLHLVIEAAAPAGQAILDAVLRDLKRGYDEAQHHLIARPNDPEGVVNHPVHVRPPR